MVAKTKQRETVRIKSELRVSRDDADRLARMLERAETSDDYAVRWDFGPMLRRRAEELRRTGEATLPPCAVEIDETRGVVRLRPHPGTRERPIH